MFQHYQTPAGCAEARFRNAARTPTNFARSLSSACCGR